MNSYDRFLNAFTNRQPDRPPVWIMRQAGRYLPEYRALKEQYDFVTLVRTPELAAEVTLQPLQRFSQLDAAIIFSDILIVPEALGVEYSFRETGGIEMQRAIRSAADIATLRPEAIRDKTDYMPAALKLVRTEIGREKALLGFAGSPWTLATYLIEGGSSRDFSKTKAFVAEQPEAFSALMEKLTAAVAELILSQIEAGVDAVQIFDSWASAVPENQYAECSLNWIKAIRERLPDNFPIILFAKGKAAVANELLRAGTSGLAIDHSADLAAVRAAVPPDITLQGNLNPELMTGDPTTAATATAALLQKMAPWQRYIFNLGHGITPQARIETVQAVLETIDNAAQANPSTK
jgi:uroporphyrinogen decarboxylase